MSDIYSYNPQPPYLSSGYVNTSYSPQGSPFIPHVSPYMSTTPLPGSPSLGGTLPLAGDEFTPNTGGSLLFPGFDPAYQPAQPDVFAPIRPRRPSWHAGQPSPFSPPPVGLGGGYLSPSPGAFDIDPLYHSRRRSFGGGAPLDTGLSWGPQIFGNPLTPSQFDLHPWLNAQTWTGEFILDLSAHQFNPLQLLAANQTVPVPLEWLMMPATRPPINRLRIVCDLIPQWPIDVQYNAANATSPGVIPVGSPYGLDLGSSATPPITVADILYTIHRTLHTRISHSDWARLNLQEETRVARVYTKRCKATGSLEAVERAQGVKRVDFLLGKVYFRGLVMDWANGVMKMIVA
ncbi:hypothetical protein VKT23_011209 [Stygiomarasmius scandens]|uniref:DUF6699 domain-containing protein n=1 Tax=Marasmiellus scandens TaxID=2682957 RepID=A0ABR1JC72_9AGAR